MSLKQLKTNQLKMIERGSSSELESSIHNVSDPIFIIDANVYRLYQSSFTFINEANFPCWISPAGETTKNFKSLEKCLNYFLKYNVTRNTHLFVIGGGATSDFGGLVAHLILRGISWSVIPTTLLAMVDASIGGKVAISNRSGKNLIGSFHMPQTVYINPTYLETLPEAEISSGKGEIIKYAFLSKKIYDLVINNANMSEIIFECASLKKAIIEADPFETKNSRIQLNLGHTIGHAIEKAYSIHHGTAVSLGIWILHNIFPYQNFATDYQKICTAIGMSNEPDYSFIKFKRLKKYLEIDKKRDSKESINIVSIDEIGKFQTKNINLCDLETKLQELL